MNKRIIFLSIKLTLFLFLVVFAFNCHAENSKSDQDRVNDIHFIASLIEEHKAIHGEYPFNENWKNVEKGMAAVPILVNFNVNELPVDLKYPPPGMSGVMLDVEKFESYLSSSLGRAIVLPRDDREIENSEGILPHFYQFLYDGNNYFLSCYLQTSIYDSRQLNNKLYKYEVSSIAIPKRKIKKYTEIIK